MCGSLIREIPQDVIQGLDRYTKEELIQSTMVGAKKRKKNGNGRGEEEDKEEEEGERLSQRGLSSDEIFRRRILSENWEKDGFSDVSFTDQGFQRKIKGETKEEEDDEVGDEQKEELESILEEKLEEKQEEEKIKEVEVAEEKVLEPEKKKKKKLSQEKIEEKRKREEEEETKRVLENETAALSLEDKIRPRVSRNPDGSLKVYVPTDEEIRAYFMQEAIGGVSKGGGVVDGVSEFIKRKMKDRYDTWEREFILLPKLGAN